MNIRSKLAITLASMLLASAAQGQPVPVPQDTFQDVRLGTNFADFYFNPLLEGNAQTYTLTAGNSLLFGLSVFGQVPDILKVDFGGSAGLGVTPTTQLFPYAFGGGNNFTQELTFTGAPGTYTGNIFVDFLGSTADYNRGGTFQNGANFSFTVNLLAPVSAVPEPETWAMMILGFGMIGGALRNSRRKKFLSPATV